MVINIMIFLYEIINGSISSLFANNYIRVFTNHEYYRLLTSIFLHADIIHIACNMYALYVLGPIVERYYGKSKFLLIYFVSGLLGNLFSCLFMSELTYSLGASGALFGLLGSIAYFTYYYRATLQGFLRSQIIPTLLVNLAIGFMIPGIDISAHIGGLIGGILISMGIGIGDRGRNQDRINGIVVLILLIIAIVYLISTK
jgi:rhomboid protease GluP